MRRDKTSQSLMRQQADGKLMLHSASLKQGFDSGTPEQGPPPGRAQSQLALAPLKNKVAVPYLQRGESVKKGPVPSAQSVAKLDEWAGVFQTQNNRWESSFGEVKNRFLSSIEAEATDRGSAFLTVERKKQPGEVSKIKIPDPFLSMEKRSVAPGLEGFKEKLRRDKEVVSKKRLKLRYLTPLSPTQKSITYDGSVTNNRVGNALFSSNKNSIDVRENAYGEDELRFKSNLYSTNNSRRSSLENPGSGSNVNSRRGTFKRDRRMTIHLP